MVSLLKVFNQDDEKTDVELYFYLVEAQEKEGKHYF